VKIQKPLQLHQFYDTSNIYRYDGKVVKTVSVSKVDFNPADYETKQVFLAKDGTRCLCLSPTKRAKLMEITLYLYGYVGFNVSLPAFL